MDDPDSGATSAASERTADAVAAVRAFNRFYTARIGVLDAGLLDTTFSLTEARTLYELAQRPATDTAELRAALGIDAGYLSRVLGSLETDGLIARERSATDRRRVVLRLTDAGRSAFGQLDERSAAEIGALLDPLPLHDRRRLVGAMTTIRSILTAAPRPHAFVIRQPEAGDLGWVIERHGALYAHEYGWDETFEALVARIVADFAAQHDPRRESAWIAEVDRERAGCVFCVRKDGETAQLRLLLVDPSSRGAGIGSRLVEECIRFARRAGYRRMVLWTNDVLVEARRIYERAGFRLADEERHHSFGHDLVGQTWTRDL